MGKFKNINTYEKRQANLYAKGLYSHKLVKASQYLDFFKTKKGFVAKKDIKVVDITKFNFEQRRLYDCIENHIKRGSKPLRLIVNGHPGTGKTFFILGLQQMLRKYKIPFVAAAFTGCASAHINGSTIHSALGLNYCYRNNPPTANCFTARRNLRGVKWLIIDEISLIGLRFLKYISDRLCAILGDSRPFGNLNVILIGDWGQLPCVFDIYAYKRNLTEPEDIAASKLYHSFEKAAILTTQMRQLGSDEEEFRKLLDRVRMGAITEADVKLLNTRVISNLPKEEAEEHSLWLFADNSGKDEYNEFRLNQQTNPIHEIPAIDAPDTPPEFNRKLKLAVNIPVMLTRNVELRYGLYNGAIGILTDMIRDETGIFVALMIKFPSYCGPKFSVDGSVPIKRVEIFECDRVSGYEFKSFQFPVCIHYGQTIHKAQGSTLDKVTIALVEPECRGSLYYKLAPAMAVVSMSRVKKLKDLKFNRPFDINLVNRKVTTQVADRLAEEERLIQLQANTFE